MVPHPVTLWSTRTSSCVLRQTDGVLELLLYRDGRVTRLHNCQSEQAPRKPAYEWRLARSSPLYEQ